MRLETCLQKGVEHLPAPNGALWTLQLALKGQNLISTRTGLARVGCDSEGSRGWEEDAELKGQSARASRSGVLLSHCRAYCILYAMVNDVWIWNQRYLLKYTQKAGLIFHLDF